MLLNDVYKKNNHVWRLQSKEPVFVSEAVASSRLKDLWQ